MNSEYSALLSCEESECTLGCGCVMNRPTGDDQEVAITFCPMHEQAEKVRAVLGRLHDGLSDMIENGRLTEGAIPDDYQWIVSLLVNESLPLFPGDERVKSEAASGAAVAPSGVALAALRDVLPHVPGYANKDAAGRPWIANALAVVGEAPPAKSAADLINRVFSKVNDETETWRAEPIGADLAYLAWAIAEGPGKGFVEWGEDDSTMVSFKHWFPAGDPVWQFIKEA